MGLGLGRLPKRDPRDERYRMDAVVPGPRSAATRDARTQGHRYWWSSGWWGNQKWYPHCVAFAWLHFLEDGPITQPVRTPGMGPVMNPTVLYNEAQRIDEWPGTNYDGTSVRAGAKVLQRVGHIGAYRWGFTLDELVRAVLTMGPVVVGTWWYENMFFPDDEGVIRVGGPEAGGHAYLVNGVNVRRERVRIKNSWGRGWGNRGHVWLPFEDMTRLIREDGEVCIAEEVARAA